MNLIIPLYLISVKTAITW